MFPFNILLLVEDVTLSKDFYFSIDLCGCLYLYVYFRMWLFHGSRSPRSRVKMDHEPNVFGHRDQILVHWKSIKCY